MLRLWATGTSSSLSPAIRSVGGSSGETVEQRGVFLGSVHVQIQRGKPLVCRQAVGGVRDHDPQIGGSHVGDDALDAVAHTLDGVLRLGVAFVGRRAEHQREVSAGAHSVHAEAFGIDLKLVRVQPDIPHGPPHV